jgi:hypothetical protein
MTMIREKDILHIKNPKTGEVEIIFQYNIELFEDGEFYFFVETETNAYKAAYMFQNRQTKVEYSHCYQKWLVRVLKK